MVTENVTLKIPERFAEAPSLDRAKLVRAAEKATDKLEVRIKTYGVEQFPYSATKDFKFYNWGENKDWTTGMYTGCFWLAYEITGNKIFRDAAEKQLPTFKRRYENKVNMDDHDVGFEFIPSAVAQYKLTGSEEARELALKAVDYFYEHSYSKEGKFIIRSHRIWNNGGNRTMMDSLMNAPFFLWATEQTGDPKYAQAGIDHVKTTNQYLIRHDGSSCHHYIFDPETCAPVGEITWQGHRNESCWSRGHAWGIYGFPVAYSYKPEELSFIPKLHKDITYYMLNYLPEDLIPYWDYDFTFGKQPRDASAAVIAVCGMHEMNKMLPDGAEQKPVFENASAMLLNAVIDRCTTDIGKEYDGLIHHVSHAIPIGQGVDECAVYGDYFYLEALARYLKPDFKTYW